MAVVWASSREDIDDDDDDDPILPAWTSIRQIVPKVK